MSSEFAMNTTMNTSSAEASVPKQNTTHFVSTEGGVFAGKGLLNSPLGLFLVQVRVNTQIKQ